MLQDSFFNIQQLVFTQNDDEILQTSRDCVILASSMILSSTDDKQKKQLVLLQSTISHLSSRLRISKDNYKDLLIKNKE